MNEWNRAVAVLRAALLVGVAMSAAFIAGSALILTDEAADAPPQDWRYLQ